MDIAPEITWMPLVFVPILAAVWFRVNHALFADWLSPLSILFFSWVLPVSLQAMNLSGAETAWSVSGILVVGWVTLSMTMVCLLAHLFVSGTDDQEAVFARTLRVVSHPTFLAVFAVAYCAVVAVYVYVEFITNPVGIPLLTIIRGETFLLSSVHRWGKESSIQAIVSLLSVFTPLAYLAFRASTGRIRRALLLAAVVLYPVGGVLKLSRVDVFIALLGLAVAAACYSRWSPHPRSRHRGLLAAVAIATAAVGLMYAMMSIRLLGLGVDELYAELIDFRLDRDVPLRGVLASIYGYTAMPFENLNRFMAYHSGFELHPGLSVLRPPLSASGLGNLADAVNAEVFYPAPFSGAAGSATFLTAVYAELGLIGAAFVPLLYAGLVNVIYVRMRRRPTLAHVLLYALFIYPWAWLFFNNGFGVLSVYVSAAFAIGLGFIPVLFATPVRLPSRALEGAP